MDPTMTAVWIKAAAWTFGIVGGVLIFAVLWLGMAFLIGTLRQFRGR